MLHLTRWLQRISITASSVSITHRIRPLRLLSSQASYDRRPAEPRKFKNMKVWVIRQWFLDNNSHPHPTPTQMDDLVAATEIPRKRILEILYQLRTGVANPHSLRGGRGTWIINEWFIKNHHCPYPDEAEKARLADASGFSIKKVAKQLASLRNIIEPPEFTAKVLKHPPGTKEPCLYYVSKKSISHPSKRVGRRQWPERFADTASGADKDGVTTISGNATSKIRTPYVCTVCQKSFTIPSFWKDHEMTTHEFNPTEWICMPHGLKEVGSTCDFCFEPIEDLKHFEKHRTLECAKRDCKDRTFRSKRKLLAHIRQQHLRHATHETKLAYQPRADWERVRKHVDPNALWCGFCQIELESVHARMDHVAQHFKHGETMNDWIPKLPSS
ncbi:uncharacterized protein EKO05_0005017 [Ascochyta rabiei]|uniref:uncharacterized protein n=1 Tax=Didymella rabiei TaxID=5454 RepID=UPI0022068347|nr:uncharacterized protein EKO05_0005017 [Ascochyta rabiei]UPX14539.1 hypothetical protein EKO05_0005017 [Ascochyta rabiei]